MYLGTRQLISAGMALVIVGSVVLGGEHSHHHQDPTMYPAAIHLTVSGVSSSFTCL
jgi:hypothetical protein